MRLPSPFQKLSHPTYDLRIKRDDIIHPIICGNKRRKISGYLNNQNKNKQQYKSILTFGGAYSNHLRAIAHIGKLYNIHTIGIVRGEELAEKKLNNNLQFCQDQGMELHFVSRQTYRQIKTSTAIDTLKSTVKIENINTLIIPEGGCGSEGITGTHHIINEIINQKDMSTNVYFCIEAGTGTTATGCIQAINRHKLSWQTIVIPILHDLPTITQNIEKHNPHTTNYDIISGYEHGGYAKTTPKLLTFIDQRKTNHNIHIEPTYSGKLMYAVEDLIQQGYFPPDAKIIIYHSGY